MGQSRSTQTTKTRLSERTTKTAARPTPFPQSLSPGCRELQPQILLSDTPSLHVAPDALDRTHPQGCVSQQRRGRAPVVTHGVAPGTQNMEQLFTQTKFLGKRPEINNLRGDGKYTRPRVFIPPRIPAAGTH